MTEFKRVEASVEALEALVAQLASDPLAVGGGAQHFAAQSGASTGGAVATGAGLFFLFDPPARREPSSCDGEDWEVVGGMSAFEGQVPPERRAEFAEAARLLDELAPAAERMRRRCLARAELEAVRSRLRELLPDGAPPPSGGMDQLDEDFVKAESSTTHLMGDVVGDVEPADQDLIQSLLARAMELDSMATYGARMAEQAADLLARLEATRALFDTDVVPRLGAAVAAAQADEAERRRCEAHAEEAQEEAARRRAEAEANRVVAELLASSERRLAEASEEAAAAAAEAQRRRAASPPSRRCASSTSGGARAAPCARAFS